MWRIYQSRGIPSYAYSSPRKKGSSSPSQLNPKASVNIESSTDVGAGSNPISGYQISHSNSSTMKEHRQLLLKRTFLTNSIQQHLSAWSATIPSFTSVLTGPYYQMRTDIFSAVRATLYRNSVVWNDRKATLVRGTEKPPSKFIDSAIAETTGNPASTGTFRTCDFIIII
ncbi:hypothetical protein CDAR_280201 [Caerostris darwini]|uniref:Uncharacterized protein n=1 Tax=Caerostris darwini TaxID=1538125 RepID=A0AAV4NH76_9ARAC|nr:hypothetical protein CDAR_280201 [Caerostris darwini]